MSKYSKTIVINLILIGMALLLSCKIVETQSQARELKLKVVSSQIDNIKLMKHEGGGEFSECTSDDKIHFDMQIPAMSGGYTKFLFFKLKKSNPLDYKIIRIMKNEEIVTELSLNDIDQFNKDKDGYYEVIVAE